MASHMRRLSLLIRRLSRLSNAFLIPTLAVHASCSGEGQETREGLASGLEGEEKEHACGCLQIPKEEFSIKAVYEQVITLKEAGIGVL